MHRLLTIPTLVLLISLVPMMVTLEAQAPGPSGPPVPNSGAVQAGPPALQALRAEFLGQIASSSRQLTEQFANALTRLEDELAAAGDYEDAMVVQARVQEVQASLAQTPAPPPDPGVPMPADAAKISSAVTLDLGALTAWRTTGSYAEWTLQHLSPGKYSVQFSYLLAEAPVPDVTLSSRFEALDVAKFKLTEVSLLAQAAANTRLFELSRSKDPSVYSSASSEPITITRSSITLRLEALQACAANTIRIKDIRLVPVPAEMPPSPAVAASSSLPATGEKDVESLRSRFSQQFAAARMPLLADYQARLKTLAAQPAVIGESDLLDQIEAEQKRIADPSRTPFGAPGGRKRDGGAPGDSAMDGFEDLRGARLVVDPAATAERLKVEHEGRQFWIKLAWVKPLPASPDDKDAIQSAVKHFKIEPDEALTVGREVKNFITGYLEDRPLRLLVRGRKNGAGPASPALVYLDDVGLLFQLVLIDNGFAAYAPPPGNDRRPTSEMALMKMLADHEQQARKRKPAPGAWAFTTESKP